MQEHSLPLFHALPTLGKKVSHLHLAHLPTPLFHAEGLGAAIRAPHLYIKDDGMTGAHTKSGLLFGGNKVRKLEFLLADAIRCNAQSVITFGCAGSNHALATSVYAHEVGLRCHCMLKPQPASSVVARNLLLHSTTPTQLHYFPDNQTRNDGALLQCFTEKQTVDTYPYVIPTGGSNPIGTLGFINAAFELREQIDAGLMPMPEYLFVPVGSAGTITGLLIGCKLAHIPTKIIGIGVEPEDYNGMYADMIHQLFDATIEMLHRLDTSIPNLELMQDDVIIIDDCGGDGYGMITKEGQKALEIFKNHQDLQLDGVYSGKAAAGMLRYIKDHALHNNIVLFWNTFCSATEDQLKRSNKKKLPQWTLHYIG